MFIKNQDNTKLYNHEFYFDSYIYQKKSTLKLSYNKSMASKLISVLKLKIHICIISILTVIRAQFIIF